MKKLIEYYPAKVLKRAAILTAVCACGLTAPYFLQSSSKSGNTVIKDSTEQSEPEAVNNQNGLYAKEKAPQWNAYTVDLGQTITVGDFEITIGQPENETADEDGRLTAEFPVTYKNVSQEEKNAEICGNFYYSVKQAFLKGDFEATSTPFPEAKRLMPGESFEDTMTVSGKMSDLAMMPLLIQPRDADLSYYYQPFEKTQAYEFGTAGKTYENEGLKISLKDAVYSDEDGNISMYYLIDLENNTDENINAASYLFDCYIRGYRQDLKVTLEDPKESESHLVLYPGEARTVKVVLRDTNLNVPAFLIARLPGDSWVVYRLTGADYKVDITN